MVHVVKFVIHKFPADTKYVSSYPRHVFAARQSVWCVLASLREKIICLVLSVLSGISIVQDSRSYALKTDLTKDDDTKVFIIAGG